MLSRLQISDMGIWPRRSSRTILIFSSAGNFRQVAFLICFTTSFGFAIFSTHFRDYRTLIMDVSRQRKAIIAVLLFAGLRNFELTDLQYRDLPVKYGRREIIIRKGK